MPRPRSPALVTGAPTGATVLATSTGCAQESPATCATSIYSLSTDKASTGPENPIPTAPNSILFDPAGDKAFMGSDFGALLVNPTNFGTRLQPFSALGHGDGKGAGRLHATEASPSSPTPSTPNQVYIVNAASSHFALRQRAEYLQRRGRRLLSRRIEGIHHRKRWNFLYIYSTLQALQGPIALAGPANANTVGFFVERCICLRGRSRRQRRPANLTAFNTCDNQIASARSGLALFPCPPILFS